MEVIQWEYINMLIRMVSLMKHVRIMLPRTQPISHVQISRNAKIALVPHLQINRQMIQAVNLWKTIQNTTSPNTEKSEVLKR